jgi:hypothetical protein
LVFEIGVALLFYDHVIVPAMNSKEPPSPAACAITKHHGEKNVEQVPRSVPLNQNVIKSIEREDLLQKKELGALNKQEEQALRALQTHSKGNWNPFFGISF